MALRVVEHAGLSDVGRQRDANEDNYVLAAAAIFAVADGMGGAQAGEVASRTAADVFEHVSGGSDRPEQLLTDLTREANRQIFEMSQTDASRRGMGTTLTAAMVWGRRRQHRPRGRQPGLPDAGGRAGAADPRPLAGGQTGGPSGSTAPRPGRRTTRSARSSHARSGRSPMSRWTPTRTPPAPGTSSCCARTG